MAIVGKGLTFDSGGYNLKAGAGSMIEMMKVSTARAALCHVVATRRRRAAWTAPQVAFHRRPRCLAASTPRRKLAPTKRPTLDAPAPYSLTWAAAAP